MARQSVQRVGVVDGGVPAAALSRVLAAGRWRYCHLVITGWPALLHGAHNLIATGPTDFAIVLFQLLILFAQFGQQRWVGQGMQGGEVAIKTEVGKFARLQLDFPAAIVVEQRVNQLTVRQLFIAPDQTIRVMMFVLMRLFVLAGDLRRMVIGLWPRGCWQHAFKRDDPICAIQAFVVALGDFNAIRTQLPLADLDVGTEHRAVRCIGRGIPRRSRADPCGRQQQPGK